MQDFGIPLVNGVFPIVTLLCVSLLLSFFSLKFSRLEYRGYDSAGVAVYGGGAMQVRKAKGPRAPKGSINFPRMANTFPERRRRP